jgi:hypothetical protein
MEASMDWNSGVNANTNSLGPNAFAAPGAGTQGQYNPLELIMQLLKKKKTNPGMLASMTPFQNPAIHNIAPNFNQGMMPQGAISPNGQIMPNYSKGLLG